MTRPTDETLASKIDRLLHDADRAVMGSEFASMMGDVQSARRLERKAVAGYQAALNADPKLEQPAWQESGNRDEAWLRAHGFGSIALCGRKS